MIEILQQDVFWIYTSVVYFTGFQGFRIFRPVRGLVRRVFGRFRKCLAVFYFLPGSFSTVSNVLQVVSDRSDRLKLCSAGLWATFNGLKFKGLAKPLGI